MWDDVTSAPAQVSSGSIFDKLGEALGNVAQSASQAAQRKITDSLTGQATDPKLGVAEGSGKPFVAGKASFLTSGTVAGVPAPIILVGIGILALALVLHGK